MNQKGVIYIILSAILLYLYYRKRDLAIFAGFVVVVVGTLILGKGGEEGFGMGGGGKKGGGNKGGGGIDKECAKMGFKPIKLDKNDLAGTLEQVIKGIEEVAVKQWPYDGKATDDEDKKKKQKELEAFVKIWGKEAKKALGDDKTKSEQANNFVFFSAEIYEKKRYDELFKLNPEKIKNMISGGGITLTLLEKINKSDEIDSNFEKPLKYLICLCKYWTKIYKEAQKATADAEGGGMDDECAKIGFKQPKIDKNDINGSLENAMKNIEKVAETKWPFEKGDIEGKRTDDKTVKANWKVIMDSTFLKDLEKTIQENRRADKVNKEYDAMLALWGPTEELYKAFIIQKKTDEEKSAVVEKHKVNLDKIIEGGPIIIELINQLKKSDEIKEADDGVKDILKYITCLVKQWISIIKAIKKATADDAGGAK